MKKLLALLLVAVLALCVTACNEAAATDPESASFAVPGMREITGTYKSSSTDPTGTVLKFYQNGEGDELVLTADGKLRGATFAENSLTGVTADEKQADKDAVLALAADFAAGLTGGSGDYQVTLFRTHGEGLSKNYSVTMSQVLYGYRTENYVFMSYNCAGELYTFAAMTELDYSALDPALLEGIDATALEAFALGELEAESATVTDVCLCIRDGGFVLELYAESDGAEGEKLVYALR